MKAPAEKTDGARRSPREAVRTALRVPGTPLEPATRRRFEAAFNCDLGHVRIHTDAAAAQAARELEAVAFSLGRDVFFAAGAYEPHTTRGHAVVAHELVHTLQDPRRAEPDALDDLAVAPASSAVEGDAHSAAAALHHGRVPLASSAAPRRATPQIARLAAGMMFRNPNDPAQIVGALTATIKIALKNDPDDRLGRVRRSLDFLEEDTRKLALTRLERELLSPDWQHLSDLLSQPTPSGTQSGDAQDATPSDGAEPGEQDADGDAGAPTATAAQPEPASATAEKSAQAEAQQPDKPGDRAAAKVGEPKESHRERGAPKMTLHGARPRRKHAGGAGPRAPRPRRGKAAGGYALPAMGEAPEPPVPVEQPEPPVAGEMADAATAAAEPAVPEAGTEPGEAAPDIATDAQAESSAASAPGVAAASPEAATQAEVAPAEAPPAVDDAAPLAAEPAPSEASAPTEQTAATADAAPGESAPESDVAASAGGTPEPAAGAADPGPSGAPPVGDLPPETDDGSEAPSGGGGGGSALAEQPEEPAAQVPAEAEPSAALSAVASEPPDKLEPALGAVTASVGRTVGADRTELAAHPPELTPQAAAQAAGGAPPPAAPVAAASAGAVARTPAAAVPESVTIAPIPPPAPIPEIVAPSVTANADGQVTAEDAQHVRQAVDDLPDSDPALDVKITPPPDVPLTGSADPARADTQRAAVLKSTEAASADGRKDAAQPLGEGHIYPTKPPVTLRGEPLPSAPAAAAAPGPAAAGAPADPAVGIVARERSADDVQAAARRGAQDLAAKRGEQQSRATQERADSQRTVDEAIHDDATAQRNERNAARKEVLGQRADWSKEQAATVDDAGRDGDDAVRIAKTDTEKFRNDARGDARKEVDARNAEIAQTRNDAQDKARAERARAKKESDEGGFFSRIGSAIGSFFDKIKGAIKGFFNWARDKIKQAIDAVTTFVTKLIDKARDLIVAAIKLAGDVLIAIGDRVLAAFPKLRDRFRAAIQKAVDAAVATVNALADGLKKAVTGLLSLLGKALTAILDAYEALYLAAVDVVAGVVKAAINAAKAVVAALAVFAVLIRDISRDPGGWLRNLGAALMDGVRNHLWRELKLAIKEWFNSKVEAVVGIGKLIFDVLKKGGIPFRRVAAMVWSAVKAAIPRAIIEFLIQKVISMLIPAAAAVMAIIEGLQAAWATASRIIAAFESFFAFLKGVKDGHAGPLFAKAVAAAAVAVIDFTANFIISKIGKGAKGVGTRLKGIATKIMAWLKRGVAAVKRVAGKVGRAVVRGVRAVGRGLRAAGRYVAASRVGRYIATSRVGRAAVKAYERGKAMVEQARERWREWRKKRNSPEAKLARLNKAVAAIQPAAHQLLVHGVGRAYFWARAKYWQLRYGLTSLEVTGGQFVATINPRVVVDEAEQVALGRFLLDVFAHVETVLRHSVESYELGRTWRSGGVPDPHDPAAFAKLSRFEQAAIMRTGNPELTKRIIEPGVTARLSHADNPAAIEVRVGGKSPAYLATAEDGTEVGIVPMIENASKQLGLSPSETSGLLISSREDLDTNLALLEESFVRRRGVTRPPGWRARAYNLLRRAAFLVSALEPSRRAGIGSAVATAGSLGFSGKAGVREIVGGDLATMAHPLASSQRDPAQEGPAMAARLHDARRLTEQKVHRVMARLVAVSNAEHIIITPRGFELEAFARAVEDFLIAHMTNEPGRIIDELELKLAAELSLFLKAMHER
jgi:hypothetical protein